MSDIYERVGALEESTKLAEGRIAKLEASSTRRAVVDLRQQVAEVAADARNLRETLDDMNRRVTEALPALDGAISEVSKLIAEALAESSDLGALEGLDEPPTDPGTREESPDNQPAETDVLEGPDAS